MIAKGIRVITIFLGLVLVTINLVRADDMTSNQKSNTNILVLGAAGQISKMLTSQLLEETDVKLVLYGRNVTQRLVVTDKTRERLVDGDFKEKAKLIKAMQGVDIVYLNDMGTDSATTEIIIEAMQEAGIKRIIAATVAGIYDEIPGAFGEWNKRMVSKSRTKQHILSAKAIEDSSLDYTLLRLTWLYNQTGNNTYILTFKGEPFIGTQSTRQAVAQLIVDIINDSDNRFIRQSVGVGEPNTNGSKPSFY